MGAARWFGLGVLILMTGAGCAERPPGATGSERLPRIDELRGARERARSAAGEAGESGVAGAQRSVIELRLLTLPRDADLAAAWGLTTEGGAAPDGADAWLRNGLRVGVLGRGRLDEFLSSLGGLYADQVRRLAVPSRRVSVELSRVVQRAHVLRLSIGSEGGTDESLPMGRYQLVLGPAGVPGASAAVRLVPHLYYPRPSIVPRMPQEKELDGRLFDELALDVSIKRGTLVVIGPAQAPVRSGENSPTEPRRWTLGERMFASAHRGRAARMVLLIGLVEATDPDRWG